MKKLCTLFFSFAMTTVCFAGGPRFVTGTNYSGSASGKIIAWYTSKLTYFTDPGDLNANVSHDQADAMVAAAAAPWNNPYASITLTQGGALTEHVNDQNAYFNGTSLIWPADVMASNYLSKPIAIIYDIDGSVTDMLLGEGASDPAACHHNAVTESVNSFGQTGTIQHALLVLNGRCVGSTPQQLLQMQYQLERAFGRVLGLAWSQCNDNVFTAVTTVNANQQTNWPIMHPIDVICGTYTYQCLRNPFQLRVDDISSLALLYPVTSANLVPGKSLTIDANSMSITTTLYFPDLEEAEDANIVALWGIQGISGSLYESASAVSGATFQRAGYNPVTGTPAASDNVGMTWGGVEGMGTIARLPLNFANGRSNTVTVIAESVNPLYTGEYAVGTYKGVPLALYGPTTGPAGFVSTGNINFTPYIWANEEPSKCAPGNDGTLTAPVAADPTGWWTGQMCTQGHSSVLSQTIRAGRTFTVEVTSLDETGAATTRKLRPVIGLWKSTDSTNVLPTIAAATTPMNSLALGVTQLPVASFSKDQPLRIVIADAYGGGRPDFAYKARILYADSISPATIGSGGGTITITGMGFRTGNVVSVNGVRATVTSWTANQIVANIPSAAMTGVAIGTPVAVTVTDTGTNGSTSIAAALSYTTAANTIILVSAPASLETGIPAATSFSVKVLSSDGVTPVGGTGVQLSINGGAQLSLCGTATQCIVTTDANGVVKTSLTGTAAGSIKLTATELSSNTSVSATMNDVDPARSLTTSAATHYLAAGATGSYPMSIAATQDGIAANAVSIVWTPSGGANASPTQSITDADGLATATMQLASTSDGATLTACAWNTVCTAMQVISVPQPQWTIGVSTGAGQSVKTGTTLSAVTMHLTDGSGHALEGARVTVYQSDDAWQTACPSRGACPAPAPLGKSDASLVSDTNGNITFTPLVTGTSPQVVNIAASTGTQGFITMTLDVTP